MSSAKTVRLKQGRARPAWAGHPWIYSGAVARIEGAPVSGELVAVDDHEGRRIGWGHFGAGRAIAVRLLGMDDKRPDEAALLASRIDAAVARRTSFGLPSEGTDAFRMIFSEGDRLPGLVVDRLGPGLVVQLGTTGMARLEDAIVSHLRRTLDPAWVVVQVPAEAARVEGIEAQTRIVLGDDEAVAATTVREHGVLFEVDPVGGQKTGYYADQRDNRLRVADLARGRKVLDAYSYGGAFGLVAAVRGGATSVTAVDTSPRACRMASRNAEANGVSMEVIQADAIHWLRDKGPEAAYDLIVLDPPKMARSRSHVADALKKYRKINELAIRALPSDGLLVTCSCSGHVEPDDFLRMLVEAGYAAGRVVHVHEVRGQGADHPYLAACPEGRYLKCVIASVTDR